MTRLVRDKNLCQAFRRGDKAAMAEVYKEYARAIFSLLKKGFTFRTGDNYYHFQGYQYPWQTENAVQEVFLRAFSERARLAYDGLRPYRNYIFTIARNYVIDRQRKQRHEFTRLDPLSENKEEIACTDLSSHTDPEQETDYQQLRQAVREFLGELSAFERDVFFVRFREGLSVEVSAKELKTTEYKIKKQEKIIKKRFLSWMRKRGYFEGYRDKKTKGKTISVTCLLACIAGGA